MSFPGGVIWWRKENKSCSFEHLTRYALNRKIIPVKSPKKPSKELSLPSQDESRRANVLREEMLSQFQKLGEALSGLGERMERIEPQVQQTNEKVNIIEAAVRSHGADLRAIKSDVAILKSDVAEMKGDLKGYNQRLEVVEVKLAS